MLHFLKVRNFFEGPIYTPDFLKVRISDLENSQGPKGDFASRLGVDFESRLYLFLLEQAVCTLERSEKAVHSKSSEEKTIVFEVPSKQCPRQASFQKPPE